MTRDLHPVFTARLWEAVDDPDGAAQLAEYFGPEAAANVVKWSGGWFERLDGGGDRLPRFQTDSRSTRPPKPTSAPPRPPDASAPTRTPTCPTHQTALPSTGQCDECA